MGYTYPLIFKRDRLIQELIQTRVLRTEADYKVVRTTTRHTLRGSVLYSIKVDMKIMNTGEMEVLVKFIEIDVIRYNKKDGFGYKDMDESVNPYYYSCPLSYLTDVPEVSCQAWRDGVKEYHSRKKETTKKRQMIGVGTYIRFPNNIAVPAGKVYEKLGNTFYCQFFGRLYKIHREVLPTCEVITEEEYNEICKRYSEKINQGVSNV